MRQILWLFCFFCSNAFVANASSVSNVRLVDHMGYAISVVQKTMNTLERNHWCNLKMQDLKMNISENVLGVSMTGNVDFTNGFLVSLQNIDIIQSTVQQFWLPARGNTTTVEVRATVRMLDAVVGFDVIANMANKIYRSTATIRYPDIRFPFVITKHLFTDDITVTVSGSVMTKVDVLHFSPENDATKIIPSLFNWFSTAPSFQRWATDVFAPATLNIAKNKIDFPRICYNCPVTA